MCVAVARSAFYGRVGCVARRLIRTSFQSTSKWFALQGTQNPLLFMRIIWGIIDSPVFRQPSLSPPIGGGTDKGNSLLVGGWWGRDFVMFHQFCFLRFYSFFLFENQITNNNHNNFVFYVRIFFLFDNKSTL